MNEPEDYRNLVARADLAEEYRISVATFRKAEKSGELQVLHYPRRGVPGVAYTWRNVRDCYFMRMAKV